MATVADTGLGLSAAEISILRTQQQLALSGPGGAAAAPSTSSRTAQTRGRGGSRSTVGSMGSSRAASAASSGGGRLLLDAGSLTVLGAHFERLMQRIQDRVDQLAAQTEACVLASGRAAASSVEAADREIARMRDCLRQIDELEAEFERVRHVRDVVKGLRGRVEGVSRKMGR